MKCEKCNSENTSVYPTTKVYDPTVEIAPFDRDFVVCNETECRFVTEVMYNAQ
jgi:hypothetical protein